MPELENSTSSTPNEKISCINCPPFTGANSACNTNLNNRRIVILGGRSKGKNFLFKAATLDAISKGRSVLVARPKNKRHARKKETNNNRLQRP